MIAIIDYGAGNLQSVKNALDFLGEPCKITNKKSDIIEADKLILPGEGSFGDAMSCLSSSGLDILIKEQIKSGKPFLGICVGLQLLFEESEEAPNVKGLGIFKGKIIKIPKINNIKIPHMGWNNINVVKKSKILKDFTKEPYVYFVHSYYLKASDPSIISAYTEYGTKLDIAIEKDNVFATQFHVEKSGTIGLNILKNFVELEV